MPVLTDFAGAIALKDDEELCSFVCDGFGLLADLVHGITTLGEGNIGNLPQLVLTSTAKFCAVDDAARSIEQFNGVGIAFSEDDRGGGLIHLHGHQQWHVGVDAAIDIGNIEGLGG